MEVKEWSADSFHVQYTLHDVNRPIGILAARVPSHHSVFDYLQSALFLYNSKSHQKQDGGKA